jgi:hypothetical protein
VTTLGTYSFLPWLRQGLANQIQSADGDGSVRVRVRVNVGIEVRGERVDGGGTLTEPVDRSVELVGPADIVGIDTRAIVRVDPRPLTSNFEPNYLPAIEFYDEDFPWRYTPAAPDLAKGRLRPWITLIVLERGVEFGEGQDITGRPLPFIELQDLGPLPRADELWAWAHVHVNRTLADEDAEFVSHDMAAVIPRLEAVLRADPDLAYSRLVCPRKLAENTAYDAFLIPTFEGGRRAGLGLEIGDVPATLSAWDPGQRPEGLRFPYYHRWGFQTSTTGDFETLVRLLQPRPVDRRVGTREMDVQFPAPNVRGVDKPELGGILRLGGALKPPPEDPPEPPDVFETWDDPFPRPLQEDLAHLVNLADDYQAAGDPDPIVTPPLYGTWHAMTKRVRTTGENLDNWVQRLNLDPRFRTAAGFGTRVVQDQQETLMNAAWDQLGRVLEAQRRIRLGQLAVQVSTVWWDRHLMPVLGVDRQQALLLMAPLSKRIVRDEVTIHHAFAGSLVQPAMTSAPLRRMLRPRARLMSALPFDAERPPARLLERVNAGDVSAAPPKEAPPGVETTDEAADSVRPAIPDWLADLLRRVPQLPLLVLIAAIVIAILLLVILGPLLGGVLAVALIAAGVWAWRTLTRWAGALAASAAIRESAMTPEAVDAYPGASDFRITEPGSRFVPRRGPDNEEAARFKAALRGTFGLFQASAAAGATPLREGFDLAGIGDAELAAVEPARTIPRRVRASVFVPPRITAETGDDFVEPMAYPVIDLPMYEPLKNLSDELFLPNVDLIEPNSITLLETNQRFIEAYMAGLNHELACELLWREYPTDMRGSPLRQFWDPRSFLGPADADDEALKEKLRDILPLHRWRPDSALGEHDNREAEGENEEELVLVIRGELLKRYPTAVIYAHRAEWQDDGERRLAALTAAEEADPPHDKVRTPLYEAKIDPDIYFLGFDLTEDEARGGREPSEDPGWFFVIKERPGEPRFGLDTDQQPQINVWNDLSWPDVQPGPAGTFIEIETAPAAFPLVPPADDEKLEQHQDDTHVAWSHDMSAAELAYILFQAPVLVGVHASEMLR